MILANIKKVKNLAVINFALIQVISKFLTVISTYIVAFYTTHEVFGYFSLLQASLVVALTFFGFNLSSAFIRYFYEIKTIAIIKKARIIIIFLLFLSIFISIFLYFLFKNHMYYVWFSFLPIIGFIHSNLITFSMLARANNNILVYAVSELIRPIAFFVLSVICIYYKFNIIKIYVFVIFFALIISLFFCFFCYKSLLNKNLSLDNGDFFTTKEIVYYTFPLFLVQVMSLLNNVADKYIMKLYLDISDIGRYAKAYLLGSSFGMFLDSLMLLWTPYVMKNKMILLEKYVCKLIFLSIILCLVGFLGVVLSFLLYKLKVFFIFDSEMLLVFLLVFFAFVSRIGYQILTPILNAFDKTIWVAVISFMSMCIGVLFCFLLIPGFGIVGGAFSTFISYFLFSILSIFAVYFLKYKVKK